MFFFPGQIFQSSVTTKIYTVIDETVDFGKSHQKYNPDKIYYYKNDAPIDEYYYNTDYCHILTLFSYNKKYFDLFSIKPKPIIKARITLENRRKHLLFKDFLPLSIDLMTKPEPFFIIDRMDSNKNGL